MARSNPISKIKDTALDTLKGSVSTTQGVVGQAVDKARDTVDTVTALVPGRKSAPKKSGAAKSRAPRDAPALDAEGSRKSQGDPLGPAATKATKKASASSKAPAKKAAAKKPPAKKAATAKKAAKKAPAKKVTAKKAVTQIAAASDVPDITTADQVTKKATAKKPAKKTPGKKAAAKKAPSKQTAKKTSPAVDAPAAETVYSTSSGSSAESPGPSAGPSVIDPGTAKSTVSEANTLSKAADPDQS